MVLAGLLITLVLILVVLLGVIAYSMPSLMVGLVLITTGTEDCPRSAGVPPKCPKNG
jgi:hypothetical protein